VSVLKVTINHTFLGQTVDNCMGAWFPSDDLDSGDCHTVAQTFHGFWNAGILPHLHNELHLNKVTVIECDDATTGADFTGSGAGGISGALLPSFVAARVNFLTPLRGRSYRGRTGLAGLTEDMTDSLTPNNLKDTVRTDLSGAINEFVANVNEFLGGMLSGGHVAVVSTIHNGAPRVPALGTTVTGTSVSSALGTRRSRF